MKLIEIEPGLFMSQLSEEEKKNGRRKLEEIIKRSGSVILQELWRISKMVNCK